MTLASAFVEPGATETFALTADPGYLWFTNGPALTIGAGRTDEVRSFAFEYIGDDQPRRCGDGSYVQSVGDAPRGSSRLVRQAPRRPAPGGSVMRTDSTVIKANVLATEAD